MAFKIFRKNCCGLDVHKTWIYACIGITDTNSRTEYKQARFSSFRKGLQDLAEWLAKYSCTEVCMESSGKYWIPVFNVLEKTCWVVLAHPKYTKPQSVFPSSKHLASWAGCCPRNDQSGGKVKSTRISRAGSSLKPLLVQIANAVVSSNKYPECKERYRRIKARRGHKKAIIAICRMLLTAIWNVLSKGEPYSAEGYLADAPSTKTQVLTTQQALNLLKSRGYIIKDDPSFGPA